MNYTLVTLFSFSVIIAAVIGLIRFNKIDPLYYPFIFCMWVAALNEILGYTLIKLGLTTTINNNIYTLLEALLITWQFKKWDVFYRYNRLYGIILFLIVIGWILENIGLSTIHKVGFYFRVMYAFMVVLMSIDITTWVMFHGRKMLLKDPVFLIGVGYIIFFTFKILTEAFWFYGVSVSGPFSVWVFIIFTWINLFVNLLFGIAVLCIPLRPRYISF